MIKLLIIFHVLLPMPSKAGPSLQNAELIAEI